LREGPSRNSLDLGVVAQNSLVKVLQTNGRWAQVVVSKRARPKEKPEEGDQGWLHSGYLKANAR
jgi:hypothetical protein